MYAASQAVCHIPDVARSLSIHCLQIVAAYASTYMGVHIPTCGACKAPSEMPRTKCKTDIQNQVLIPSPHMIYTDHSVQSNCT